MEKFLIKGGKKIHGKIQAGTSKNCALPTMFATLLAEGRHYVNSVPRLQDMESTLRMLVHLGCQVEQKHKEFGSDWVVDATQLSGNEAPYDLVRKMRASVLCLGPLLARTGHARVSLPGGCAIGARPIDLHLMAFEKMGARVNQKAGYVEAQAPLGGRLLGAEIVFPVVSVGATENVVMAATLAKGTTILENAAREPEVRDLCVALQSMGADIEGVGSSRLVIHGKVGLAPMNFTVPPDRIEVATYLIAAHLTGGEIEIDGARAEDLRLVLDLLTQSGAEIKELSNGLRLKAGKQVLPVSIETAPYPGFPTDLQAQWLVLMTQAKGPSTIHETIFENRFMHVPELQRMGADAKISASMVAVSGESTLQGAPVMATDLRASASLVLAGLVAIGETQVKRIYHLDRGYESMEVKLRSLGVEVERASDS